MCILWQQQPQKAQSILLNVLQNELKPVRRKQVDHYVNFYPRAVHAIDVFVESSVGYWSEIGFISFKINLELFWN